jgi:hypothetical protein
VAEIIVAEYATGRVDIWSGGVLLPCVDTSFRRYDHLACGDVDEDGQAEIIVADNDWGWIDMITYGRSYAGDRDRLCDLIKVGGLWSSQLTSDWTKNGYLLIVGETEIIPAGTCWHEYDYGAWSDYLYVHCTDIHYANTEGDWVYPELNIGRIIGNDARKLTIPIEASIGVHRGLPGYEFDRSHALVVAGRGDGVEEFEGSADETAKILDDEFIIFKLKQKGIEKAGGNISARFQAYVSDIDVIFYVDHCGAWSWGSGTDVVNTGDFVPTNLVNFGNTKPFVFASCCLAGQYAGIAGIAEYFLEYGAAAYIGATELAWYPTIFGCSNAFFKKWVNSGKTIGLAFKEVKRKLADGLWGAASYNRYQRRNWLSEFQLYGDRLD